MPENEKYVLTDNDLGTIIELLRGCETVAENNDNTVIAEIAREMMFKVSMSR